MGSRPERLHQKVEVSHSRHVHIANDPWNPLLTQITVKLGSSQRFRCTLRRHPQPLFLCHLQMSLSTPELSPFRAILSVQIPEGQGSSTMQPSKIHLSTGSRRQPMPVDNKNDLRCRSPQDPDRHSRLGVAAEHPPPPTVGRLTGSLLQAMCTWSPTAIALVRPRRCANTKHAMGLDVKLSD